MNHRWVASGFPSGRVDELCHQLSFQGMLMNCDGPPCFNPLTSNPFSIKFHVPPTPPPLSLSSEHSEENNTIFYIKKEKGKKI